jgi:hypothetical protein
MLRTYEQNETASWDQPVGRSNAGEQRRAGRLGARPSSKVLERALRAAFAERKLAFRAPRGARRGPRYGCRRGKAGPRRLGVICVGRGRGAARSRLKQSCRCGGRLARSAALSWSWTTLLLLCLQRTRSWRRLIRRRIAGAEGGQSRVGGRDSSRSHARARSRSRWTSGGVGCSLVVRARPSDRRLAEFCFHLAGQTLSLRRPSFGRLGTEPWCGDLVHTWWRSCGY